jgi:hypothetical protein
MIRPMNFCMLTNEDIHTAFEQGEAAVIALFHEVPTQVAELAQQLAKQAIPPRVRQDYGGEVHTGA